MKPLKHIIDRKTLFSSSIGNFLEFYDFSLYAFLISVLAPSFFPSTNTLSSTISTLGVFAVGFLARPVGAIIFGHIGDIYGRKPALLLSIFGMALPTIIIGLLPTYAQIGIFAPILLTICRLIQGICVGGEYNGAGIFVVEHAKSNKGFLGSILTSAGTLGAFFASIIAYICVQPWVPTWSWRVAFLLGGLIGIVAIYLRNNILDSPEFKKSTSDRKSIPIIMVLKKHLKSFVYCISLGGMAVAPFYYVLSFLNPYLVLSNQLTLQQMMLENTIYVFLASVGVIFWGRYSDRIGLKKSMTISSVFVTLGAMLFFFTSDLLIMTFIKALIVIGSGFFAAPLNAHMSSLFPAKYRYSGVSLGYAIGMAILGGTVPYISGVVTKGTGVVSHSTFIILCIAGFYFFMSWRVNVSKKNLL